MSPSGSLMNYPKNISSEKKLQKEQEYYVTTSKWAVPSRVSQERNQSNDIALQNNQTNNKSAIIQSNNINYHNSNVVVPRRTPANNFNNSSIKAKNYQNSGNILAWQEENINYQANERKKQNNIVNLKEKNPEIKEKNMERGNRMGKEIFNQNFNQENSQKNKYQFYSEVEEKNNEKMLLVAQNERNEELKSINSKVQRAIPESRDRFIKTNDQEYENTLNTIKNIEKNLMLAQIQKEKVLKIFKELFVFCFFFK